MCFSCWVDVNLWGVRMNICKWINFFSVFSMLHDFSFLQNIKSKVVRFYQAKYPDLDLRFLYKRIIILLEGNIQLVIRS